MEAAPVGWTIAPKSDVYPAVPNAEASIKRGAVSIDQHTGLTEFLGVLSIQGLSRVVVELSRGDNASGSIDRLDEREELRTRPGVQHDECHGVVK